MSDEVIKVHFSPDVIALQARFKTLPARVLEAARKEMDRQNELTVGHIKAEKLSQRGPLTLGVITNRLRASLTRTDARVVEGKVVSAIGSNVVYMGPHEFGYDGEVSVKQHIRQTATRFAIDNGRTTVSRSIAQRLGVLTKKGTARKGAAAEVAGKQTTVSAHMRHMKVKERAPIRTGISERLDAMVEGLSNAMVKEALNG